jgi:uncharacterized protein (TIGR00369 family)
MKPSEITTDQAQAFMDSANHCRTLGLTVIAIDNGQLTIELPYSEKIIGNPASGIIHGGALTTLLDTTCGFSVPMVLNEYQLSPTLDLRIDYMRAPKPHMSVYAQAEVYRITRNIVFVRGCAFQEDITDPVASCVATFMRLSIDQYSTTTGTN